MATTTEERAHIVSDLSGGMQRRTSEFLSGPSEIYMGKNIDLQFMLGAIAKGPGYVKKGDTINSGNTILGCGSLNTSGGTNKLLAFSGTDAYVWNSGTGAWDAQSRSYTAAQSFEVERFLDMLFVVNGLTDAPESYTGSAWSTTTNVTDMPKAKYIKEYNQRLYLFNINIPVGGSFASRVWFSDLIKNGTIKWGFESGTDLATTASSAVVTSAGALFTTRNIKVGDPFYIVEGSDIGEYEVRSVDSATQITLTTALTATASNIDFWCGGNWFDVARDNSDVGMGLGKNSDRILLFKRNSMYKFQKTPDESTDTLIEIRGVPGTVSQRSVVNIRDWTFYWADSGLWRYNGSTSQLMSNPLQEVVDGIAAASLNAIVGWSVDDRLVKFFLGDITNAETGLTVSKCVYVYDPFSNAQWIEEYDDTIKCTTKWVEDSVTKNFIFSSGGLALLSESGLDFNTVDFPMEVETNFIFPISPEVSVDFTRFRVYTRHGEDIDVQYKLAYYDGRVDEDWRKLGVSYKTQHEQELIPDLATNKASGFALKMRDSSQDTRPIIKRLVAYYTGADLR